MKTFFSLILLTCAVSMPAVYAWTPLPIEEDPLVFMPGSQPGSASLESADRCDNCHGGYHVAVEPAHNWRGSMMANAARDPLWMACLTVALQDSIWLLGNANAGDLCIRCHSPGGWLEGRSDPPNTSALTGSDFEGVSCDFCHRAVDPFYALAQEDVPLESDPAAVTEAELTGQRDFDVLSQLALFDGTPFFDTATGLPVHFGDGTLPNYIEAASGQYVVDPDRSKRGPRYDAEPKHQWNYSRFHRSKYFCATCHDVSNPALANGLLGDGVSETQAAASYFHVERTFSEFMLSAYGKEGGAAPNPEIGVPWVAKCQDCHMRDVSGKACNKSGIATRSDLALHDLTGGNTWITGILASADPSSAAYDPYNYDILSGAKYPGAKVDVAGLQGYGGALLDAQARALQQLQMAATLTASETSSEINVRIRNNAGHKLISGFPEGRRLWLSVNFYDAAGALIGQINPYLPLVTQVDAQGNEQYVSGGTLVKTHDDLVFEAAMESELTGEPKSFHFVLATSRYKDNRIPPKGFEIAAAGPRQSVPRWGGSDAPGYFTTDEYTGGFHEVTITKPAGTASWDAGLYYQTTSKEYVAFLYREIEGTGGTLSSPTPSGEPEAYIAQTDPYFEELKDWGKAIWDLWLHNGGSAPVLVTSIGMEPPCDVPSEPTGLTVSATHREVDLHWSAVTGADGYHVYLEQGGKRLYLDSTSETHYSHKDAASGETYCYTLTAYRLCPDGTETESIHVEPAVCVTVPAPGNGKGNK